ncbi:endonuclease VII domain-containing protein [Streptomyces roseoverticillatus]|uniref:endonuclease VII domain-containing protein n=1 Tax=Streptomyces roseoverticillatus TaxID=66429 RepID=UPI0033D1B6CD
MRRRRALKERYKITPAQYDMLLSAQDGTCAMCKKPPAPGKWLTVDHCHATGKVRALPCTGCNAALGMYELYRQAAADYLAAYGNGNPLLKE